MLHCYVEVPACAVLDKVRRPLERLVAHCVKDLQLPAIEVVYVRKAGPEDRGPFVFASKDPAAAALLTAVAKTTPPRLLVRVDEEVYADAACISAARSLVDFRRTLDGQGEAPKVEDAYARQVFYKLFGHPAIYVPEIGSYNLTVSGVFRNV